MRDCSKSSRPASSGGGRLWRQNRPDSDSEGSNLMISGASGRGAGHVDGRRAEVHGSKATGDEASIQPRPGGRTARSIALTTIPTITTTTAPTTLCQRKATLVNEATHATEAMPAMSADERARARRDGHGHGEDEYTENRPVEERPEPVHDLDERPQVGCPDCDGAREEPPEPGHRFRDREIVRVGWRRAGTSACRNR